MNEKIIWNNVLDIIKNEISSLSFETWFKETKIHEINDNKIIIIVPLAIHKQHLYDNYLNIIIESLSKVYKEDCDVEFLLEDEIDNNKENITINNDNNYFIIKKDNLNSNYTFNNFIVGNSNKFAHASALSVAENPGKIYNPLFIYGNSGLGKTHLMHAIGNYVKENSNKKVLYVTSEQFISDYIGISKDNLNNNYADIFKDKYRSVDVLLIDDIQFLGGATKTQQEFFHTFNFLYGENKQIIISSDRSPDDLKLLEDRLRTRFCWGLTVDIYPPDFELRKEILKKKISSGAAEVEFPEDVIEYIASNIGNDVRQLEGSITRILAYSTIMGGSIINLVLAMEALKDYAPKGISEKDNINKIQKVVAEYFHVTVDDLKSKNRSSNLSFPRQVAMYLCRTLTNESFPKIGTEFGGKDHSTVMHSVNKIERELKNNKELYNIIEKIKESIK